jgi:hypothetical protein
MAIDIRGIDGNRLLQAHVRRQMSRALAPLRVTPVGAAVVFLDENGPKGGIDIRCTLTVRVPFQPSVRVEHMGPTHRRAFDQAFAALERRLDRDTERARQSRRRPKKYFVAKRLLTGTGETPGKPTRRAT